MYPFRSPLKETQSAVMITGHTWCLVEISDTSNPRNAPLDLFKSLSPDPPAIVSQHVLQARKYVLLSAQGSHVITTNRPLEQLKSLLYASASGESDAMAAFFQQHGVKCYL